MPVECLRLLQIASTSRALSTAVDMCLRPNIGLCICWPAAQAPVQLGTRLLLSWAKHVSLLSLDHNNLCGNALGATRTFLAHATSLSSVCAVCNTLQVAATADQLFGRSATIRRLMCAGVYLPAILAPNLERLGLAFDHFADYENDIPGSDNLLEVAVIRVNTWVSSLRSLELILGEKPVMACESFLPELQRMHITFTVSETAADLSWLRTQPCKCLNIIVIIAQQSSAPQSQALVELQQLHSNKVTLQLGTYFSVQMQAIWQHLSSPRIVHLRLGSTQPANLSLLPSSPRVDIQAIVGQRPVWHISWESLTTLAQHICILAECSGDKGYLSFDMARELVLPTAVMSEAAIEPWQLTVSACRGLRLLGLPGHSSGPSARPLDNFHVAPFILQNRAAARAGWTADS